MVAVVAAGAAYVYYAERRSALDTAMTWAGLAPLPDSARNVQVDAKGSMFSREVVIRFDAPAAAIQRWIAESPGPSSAVQSTAGSITTYAIKPRGGAQFAEVTVDGSINRVVIRVYWS